MAIIFFYTVIKDRPRKLHQRNPEFCPVKPDPTAPHFPRLWEPWSLPAEWTGALPLWKYFILKCCVILAEAFQVPVTALYIFIKVHLETGPVVQALCSGHALNPSPHRASFRWGWGTQVLLSAGGTARRLSTRGHVFVFVFRVQYEFLEDG